MTQALKDILDEDEVRKWLITHNAIATALGTAPRIKMVAQIHTERGWGIIPLQHIVEGWGSPTAAQGLRIAARHENATMILWVDEIWYKAAPLGGLAPFRGDISKDPDRQEGIVFGLEKGGISEMFVIPITRRNGVPSIPLEPPALEEFFPAWGRFAHILGKGPAPQEDGG